MTKELKNIKHIAIMNLGFIGDLINTSPVCAQLKKQFPDSKLTFITINPSFDTAKNIPGVDNVLLYDRRGIHKGLGNLLKLTSSYRNQAFDLVVVLDNSLRSAFFAYLLGARYRAGRTGEFRSLLLTHKIPHLEEEKNMQIHITEHYMRVLKPLGLYTSYCEMGFGHSIEDEAYVDSVLSELNVTKKMIGLCTCTRNPDKNWNPEQAADFIDMIKKNTDYEVVLIGDNSAREFIVETKKMCTNDFIDLTARTTIPQLGALMEKFEKFVSVDTGPMHIAFAKKVPTVSLFFCEIYKKWGPKDLTRNRLLYSPTRNRISAEQVFAALEEI